MTGMEQMTLFDREMPQPLAARLRPRSLEEYAGQTHLLGTTSQQWQTATVRCTIRTT